MVKPRRRHFGPRQALYLIQHGLGCRDLLAVASWRGVALVHCCLAGGRALPRAADNLRQQGRQAHVAGYFQASTGEKLLYVDSARHDAEEVILSHFDRDVRSLMPATPRAGVGAYLGPVGESLAEVELEHAFDADGMGIDEQFFEYALKVHGKPRRLSLCRVGMGACGRARVVRRAGAGAVRRPSGRFPLRYSANPAQCAPLARHRARRRRR